mmetsp:Transcript_24740/g.27399  ORF Transcript_24740/g.27399 Transcript_24740/m.27399 type:complete len:368 (+) Transcript_24740:101-1204(+)
MTRSTSTSTPLTSWTTTSPTRPTTATTPIPTRARATAASSGPARSYLTRDSPKWRSRTLTTWAPDRAVGKETRTASIVTRKGLWAVTRGSRTCRRTTLGLRRCTGIATPSTAQPKTSTPCSCPFRPGRDQAATSCTTCGMRTGISTTWTCTTKRLRSPTLTDSLCRTRPWSIYVSTTVCSRPRATTRVAWRHPLEAHYSSTNAIWKRTVWHTQPLQSTALRPGTTTWNCRTRTEKAKSTAPATGASTWIFPKVLWAGSPFDTTEVSTTARHPHGPSSPTLPMSAGTPRATSSSPPTRGTWRFMRSQPHPTLRRWPTASATSASRARTGAWTSAMAPAGVWLIFVETATPSQQWLLERPIWSPKWRPA